MWCVYLQAKTRKINLEPTFEDFVRIKSSKNETYIYIQIYKLC